MTVLGTCNSSPRLSTTSKDAVWVHNQLFLTGAGMVNRLMPDCLASSLNDTMLGANTSCLVHAMCRRHKCILPPASLIDWQSLALPAMQQNGSPSRGTMAGAGIPQLCSLEEGNAGSGQQALH